MFVKKTLWDYDPVLPCFKREGAAMALYHPLTKEAEIYTLSGRYLGAVKGSELEVRARIEKERRFAESRQLPCERAIALAKHPDKVNDILKEKMVKVFGQNDAGEWIVKEEQDSELGDAVLNMV